MNWYRLEFLKQSNRHLPGDFSSDDDDYQSLNKRKDEEELSDEYVWLFYRDKIHVDKRYERKLNEIIQNTDDADLLDNIARYEETTESLLLQILYNSAIEEKTLRYLYMKMVKNKVDDKEYLYYHNYHIFKAIISFLGVTYTPKDILDDIINFLSLNLSKVHSKREEWLYYECIVKIINNYTNKFNIKDRAFFIKNARIKKDFRNAIYGNTYILRLKEVRKLLSDKI